MEKKLIESADASGSPLQCRVVVSKKIQHPQLPIVCTLWVPLRINYRGKLAPWKTTSRDSTQIAGDIVHTDLKSFAEARPASQKTLAVETFRHRRNRTLVSTGWMETVSSDKDKDCGPGT